jgi:hypothetical protein
LLWVYKVLQFLKVKVIKTIACRWKPGLLALVPFEV